MTSPHSLAAALVLCAGLLASSAVADPLQISIDASGRTLHAANPLYM